MIFIAGIQPKIRQYRCTTVKHCFRCNNDSQWILQKEQQFVSLFFLPVVPVKTVYLCTCPICGNAEILDRNSFEQKVQFEAVPM